MGWDEALLGKFMNRKYLSLMLFMKQGDYIVYEMETCELRLFAWKIDTVDVWGYKEIRNMSTYVE